MLRTNTAGGQGVDDMVGHGTHVTGIVGASSNNGIGVAGINWASPILIYKVQAPDGSAPASAIAAACTDALGYISANTMNGVVNVSIGQASVSSTLYDMCDSVQTFNAQHGGSSQAIICAAAGNRGTAPAWYPAGYSVDFPTAVVGVGATDQTDELAGFSNRGSGTTLMAPGQNIYSTTKDGGYGLKSGTSMACPLVSGLLSLIWSLHPRFSSAEAIAMLTSNCFPLAGGDLPNPTWGYGRVTAITESRFRASRLQVQTGSAPDPGLTLAFNTYNSVT